ncbi:DeoR family transcriptional regulator [Virgibacillus byunsanensis]|uniref:DeoR family transcriptional regulator n=1 Tax=Virgibacillus byunsanensis TaxID=570945 RepID=A0ABW3LLW7_9BACI
MLPIERQNRIREFILEKQNMKISELSKEIGVSEMTIHRDLKPLIDEGIVIKTFGGVTLVRENTNEFSVSEACVFCSRKVNERLAYRLFLPNNKIEMTCCAHCGLLRHRQLGDKVVQAICPDFFRQTTISAPLAWYVMDTSVQMGCCHPQVLTFEWKEHADKFVKGFGGKVYSFSEAIETIFQKMNGNDQCCSKHY